MENEKRISVGGTEIDLPKMAEDGSRMKAKLLPVYFGTLNERERKEFGEQLIKIRELYDADAEFLPMQDAENLKPEGTDMIIFPQLIGSIFRYKELLAKLKIPVLVITSEFGTVEMWDWEIVAWLREEVKIKVFAPYHVEMARVILRAVAEKRQMHSGVKFLMFQDNPGEGKQSNIFKRFYWWEPECARRIEETFGVKVIYSSWEAINEAAKQVEDSQARELWIKRSVPVEGVDEEQILKAVKLYIAIREFAVQTGGVIGVGSNCLNESFHSDTTPCLAWEWMFKYDHMMWACEGDLVSLASKYILYSALKTSVMMTNIYPFLVGEAACKHEKIDEFPKVEDPDNYALGVHCGYFGFVPKCFCDSWVMRPKVLEIVNEKAIVIDCRLPEGAITMAKLHADMRTLTVVEAEIEGYVQYPESDCRNGVLIHYTNQNGHKIMEEFSSHHTIILGGKAVPYLNQIAKVYDFDIKVL